MNEPEKPKIESHAKLPQFVRDCIERMGKKFKAFPSNINNVIFTYYQTIYTQNAFPPDWFIHECIHYKQQGWGKSEKQAQDWWNRYIDDPKFRYKQEIEAYRAQYAFIVHKSNRSNAFNAAKIWARELSGPLYGDCCTYNQALFAISS